MFCAEKDKMLSTIGVCKLVKVISADQSIMELRAICYTTSIESDKGNSTVIVCDFGCGPTQIQPEKEREWEQKSVLFTVFI